MGVPRYGISLRVFNSIREIPYLHVLFWSYKHNSPLLRRKADFLMHENKLPDNPQITIIECVGAHPEDGKMRWIVITKTTMIVIFNLQNSHLLTLSLPTEEVFQVNGQNQPVTNLPVQLSIFILSREKCQHQSHWIRNFRFLFEDWFSSPFKEVWTSPSVSDTEFLEF